MMFEEKAPPEEFKKLESGEQTHLLRLNQNFLIGGNVTVREFDDRKNKYTDKILVFRITGAESGEKHPAVLSPRYIILSLAPC